jgi:hypothetical protein
MNRTKMGIDSPVNLTSLLAKISLQNHRIGEIVTHEFGKEKDKLNLFCLRQLWPSLHNLPSTAAPLL